MSGVRIAFVTQLKKLTAASHAYRESKKAHFLRSITRAVSVVTWLTSVSEALAAMTLVMGRAVRAANEASGAGAANAVIADMTVGTDAMVLRGLLVTPQSVS